jgi:uncharacterized protein YndB with AHSA1/START domain
MVAQKTITIRRERFYAHAPEDVWAAITDAHALAEWFEPNNHEPITGHKFQFVCDPGPCGDSVTECEVMEADAPRKLVWSWVVVPRKPGCAPSKPMTITWTLTPERDGTKLVLEHSGAENISWLHRNMMRVGWGYMLKRLIPRVLGNVRGGEFTPGAIPLNKRAYRCKTVPEHYIR